LRPSFSQLLYPFRLRIEGFKYLYFINLKKLYGEMMNRSVTLYLAVVFSLVALVSANSICDSALCENSINVSVGKDFTISLEANPGSTGFEWWTNSTQII
jgi:hypothetical protein